jgi:sulfatase modifying factor 1
MKMVQQRVQTAPDPAGAPVENPPGAAPAPDMRWIPGGTFRMGDERFYPEERPVHTVTVDGFWLDRYQVTNRESARFVEATAYVTLAERPPNPADYPGAPPENLVPGSLVFHRTTGPVDLRDLTQWWTWTPCAYWRHPKGGSHLCAPNYCLRYRPAARRPQMIDTGMAHVGFRCAVRPAVSS